MNPPSIHYTPSLHNGDTLEELFTGREEILDDTMKRLRRAIDRGQLAQTLYVGPRGSGKTHLISLVHHRASAWSDHGTAFRLSWVNEDAWTTVNSYDDFMAAIEEGLTPVPDVAPTTGRRLTIVLTENLDFILDHLGEDGQRQLRARIERHRDLVFVASTTTLTTYLREQSEPFYGFFQTVALPGFTVDEAVSMLQKLAEQRGDHTLAVRLDEPDARARLAAIRQLTGGQPRIWSLLADGLDPSHMDELADVIISSSDDLTPLYQGELLRLSPNERRVVMALVTSDHPMTVKAIAEDTGIDRVVTAGTVRDLKGKHWLTARSGILTQYLDGRLTYYELAEPMARVYFQIKASRGQPVKMIVEFLAAWYGRGGLSSLSLGPQGLPNYVHAAHQLAESPEFIVRDRLAEGFPTNSYAERYPAKPNMALVEECSRLDDGLAELQHQSSATILMELPTSTIDLVEQQLATRSAALLRIEIVLMALNAGGSEVWLDRALDALGGVSEEEEKTAQVAVGCARIFLRQYESGLASLQIALSLGQNWLTNEEWQIVETTLGNSIAPLPPHWKATVAITVVAYVDNDDLPQWLSTVFADTSHGKSDVAVLFEEFLRRLDPGFSGIPSVDSLKVAVQNQFPLSNAASLEAHSSVASLLGSFGDAAGASQGYAQIIGDHIRLLEPDHPDILRARHNLAYWTAEAGNVEDALKQQAELLSDRERILGPDHPDTLVTRHNLAYWTAEAGNVEDALQQFTALLSDRERILGPDHPKTLVTRYNLAFWMAKAGNVEDALQQFTDVLSDRERILGPDHPDTISTQSTLHYWQRKYSSLLERAEDIT